MQSLKIFLLVFIVSITIYSQNFSIKVHPNKVIARDEVSDLTQHFREVITGETISFDKYHSPNLIWTINNITDIKTGYDYQSHGSAQQVWLDMNNPDNLHAVFIYSAVADNVWADRTSLYFGSTDAGESWFEVGGVPPNNGSSGRSGFPCIVGTSDGKAVIANHNNADQTTTRATIFIDNSPFEYNFTNYDPGEPMTGPTGYPRLAILPNNDILIASAGPGLYLNKLSGSVFSGWQLIGGDSDPETYSLAVSQNGSKIGLACLGEPLMGQAHWVLYNETTDGGLTWSSPTIVWQAYTDPGTGNILGSFRGVNLSFNGEDPCVVFEVGWKTDTGYYPGLPSEIRFWSPNISGGNSKVLADSNNVPFYPNLGITDLQYPLSRPVIGRSQSNDYLFVAFNATTGDYWPGVSSADSTAYMCGMFMYSTDGGNTWSYPERFTPITSPLIDWRYVSIVPVSPVNNDIIKVHLVMQGDPVPGSNINSWWQFLSVTAQYYHFSTEITITDVQDEQKTPSTFILEQNYPNPFNPSTKIKFTIPSATLRQAQSDSWITLKVYDVLGKAIATLVNEELFPGEYEVEFNTFSLKPLPSSGIYFYQLKVGSFIQTNKMVYLK